jgi:hypothetical protein
VNNNKKFREKKYVYIMYNTIYIRMMTEDVNIQGRAARALRALATLGSGVDVRRQHLTEAQKLYGGSGADFVYINE